MTRVLIIDDDDVLRTYAADAFRRLDYQVETAENGRQGLAMLEADPFDVVVCDFEMPGMNGREVWENLHPHYKDRFILWSGNMDEPSPSGYKLSKGGSFQELVELVKSFVNT